MVHFFKFLRPKNTQIEIYNGFYVEIKDIVKNENFMVIDDKVPNIVYINGHKLSPQSYAVYGDLRDYKHLQISMLQNQDIKRIKILLGGNQ